MHKHLNEVSFSMTESPIVIGSDATLFEAHTTMIENDIRRLPVVADDQMLIGIITLSDILKTLPVRDPNDDKAEAEAERLMTHRYVHQVMTAEPLTIAPDDSIQDAAEMMLEYKVSGLPVVEGERVVGIITESDIFRLIVESWEEVASV